MATTTVDENSIMMDSSECEIVVDDAEDIECTQYTNNGLAPCGSGSGMFDSFLIGLIHCIVCFEFCLLSIQIPRNSVWFITL